MFVDQSALPVASSAAAACCQEQTSRQLPVPGEERVNESWRPLARMGAQKRLAADRPRASRRGILSLLSFLSPSEQGQNSAAFGRALSPALPKT